MSPPTCPTCASAATWPRAPPSPTSARSSPTRSARLGRRGRPRHGVVDPWGRRRRLHRHSAAGLDRGRRRRVRHPGHGRRLGHHRDRHRHRRRRRAIGTVLRGSTAIVRRAPRVVRRRCARASHARTELQRPLWPLAPWRARDTSRCSRQGPWLSRTSPWARLNRRTSASRPFQSSPRPGRRVLAKRPDELLLAGAMRGPNLSTGSTPPGVTRSELPRVMLE